MATIDLGNGKVTVVDEGDVALLGSMRWHYKGPNRGRVSTGYVTTTTGRGSDGKQHTVYMHRLLLGLTAGDLRQVDHRDGNGLNNRRVNLRIASRSLNNANSVKRRTKVGRYKGVYLQRDSVPNGRRQHAPTAGHVRPVSRPSCTNPHVPDLLVFLRQAAAEALTLAEVGQRLSVTKERARQLFLTHGIARRVVRRVFPHALWMVQLRGVGILRYGFRTEEEAAMVYNVLARRTYGEFARLNHVEMG